MSKLIVADATRTFVKYGKFSDLPDPQLKLLNKIVSQALDWHDFWIKTYRDKFVADLDRDPAYAFNWSDNTVSAVAQYKVASIIITIFQDCEDNKKIEYTLSSINEALINMSRWPSKSTSVMSNYMHQQELAAWGQLASIVQDHKNYESKK